MGFQLVHFFRILFNSKSFIIFAVFEITKLPYSKLDFQCGSIYFIYFANDNFLIDCKRVISQATWTF